MKAFKYIAVFVMLVIVNLGFGQVTFKPEAVDVRPLVARKLQESVVGGDAAADRELNLPGIIAAHQVVCKRKAKLEEIQLNPNSTLNRDWDARDALLEAYEDLHKAVSAILHE